MFAASTPLPCSGLGAGPQSSRQGFIISVTGLLCSLGTGGNCLMSPAQSTHIFVIAMTVLQTTIWGLRQGIFVPHLYFRGTHEI